MSTIGACSVRPVLNAGSVYSPQGMGRPNNPHVTEAKTIDPLRCARVTPIMTPLFPLQHQAKRQAKGTGRRPLTLVRSLTDGPQGLEILPRHSSFLKLSTIQLTSGVGYYATAARTTLNPCVFLCLSISSGKL
jgi:hypothetical protein